MLNNDIEKMGILMFAIAAVVTVCAVVEGVCSSIGFNRIVKRFDLIETLQRCPSINELPLVKSIKWLRQRNDGRNPCDAPYPDIKLQSIPEDCSLVTSKKGIW